MIEPRSGRGGGLVLVSGVAGRAVASPLLAFGFRLRLKLRLELEANSHLAKPIQFSLTFLEINLDLLTERRRCWERPRQVGRGPLPPNELDRFDHEIVGELPLSLDQFVQAAAFREEAQGIPAGRDRLVVSRGFRAMIGDAMWVGKTAQAIESVDPRGCRRVVAIVPRGVIHVWRELIQEWSNPGEEPRILGVKNLTTPSPLPADDDGKITWVLVTYDTLTPRRKTFAQVSGGGAGDPECLTAVGAEKALQRVDDKTLKIILEPDDAATLRAAEQVQFPSWLREAEGYQAALVRIAGSILAALTAWNPDGVAVDEAHLIKNPDAARTLTVRRHIHDPARLGLLLSGTLIQTYYQKRGAPRWRRWSGWMITTAEPSGPASARPN